MLHDSLYVRLQRLVVEQEEILQFVNTDCLCLCTRRVLLLYLNRKTYSLQELLQKLLIEDQIAEYSVLSE